MLQNIEIISVNYNTPKYINNLIDSIRKNTTFDFPIRIIDGSNHLSYINQLDDVIQKFNNVSVEHFKYNIHHGPGMDYAICNSKYKYVLTIDSDVTIISNFENILCDAININKAFSGYSSYVNKYGIDVKEKNILYPHHRFLLVNTQIYKELRKNYNIKFIKHGAPCIVKFN